LADIEVLQRSLAEAEIPHRWSGRTLLVDSAAEHTVDDLLDAIEAGELASIDETAEAPDGALQDLYVHADRLARDGSDSTSRKAIVELVSRLAPDAPPFGLAGRAWVTIMERAVAVEVAITDGAELLDVAALADELRSACRPYV
jgi:hypothetical protein